MTGNVAKVYKWLIEIDGVDAFLIQECTLPEVEQGMFEINRAVNEENMKIPSKRKISNLTCKKLIPTDEVETWAYSWLDEVNEGNRAAYAKFANVILLAEDGITPVRKYDLGEIFPIKVTTDTLNRTGEDGLYETVEFAVSRFNLAR